MTSASRSTCSRRSRRSTNVRSWSCCRRPCATWGRISAARRSGSGGSPSRPRPTTCGRVPTIPLIEGLLAAGARVQTHDPKATDSARLIFGDRVMYAADPYSAAHGADALLVMTEWLVYRNPDFERVRKLVRRPLLIDGRNLYDPDRMARSGFEYHGIGRGQYLTRVLVTGAAGFIGSHLVEACSAGATRSSGSTTSTPSTPAAMKERNLAEVGQRSRAFRFGSRTCSTWPHCGRCSPPRPSWCTSRPRRECGPRWRTRSGYATGQRHRYRRSAGGGPSGRRDRGSCSVRLPRCTATARRCRSGKTPSRSSRCRPTPPPSGRGSSFWIGGADLRLPGGLAPLLYRLRSAATARSRDPCVHPEDGRGPDADPVW